MILFGSPQLALGTLSTMTVGLAPLLGADVLRFSDDSNVMPRP